MSISIESLISDLKIGRDHSAESADWIMNEILQGKLTDEQIANWVTALSAKGETPEEIEFFINIMYRYALPINISQRAVDPVGTGGDGFNTINISTTSAIIAAAAGSIVAKHGSVAATSKSGSADVLIELGVNIDLDGKTNEDSISKFGIAFMKATKYHSSLRYAAPARRAIGKPTVFNVLGPLSNPSKPKAFALGIAPLNRFDLMSEVMRNRGADGFIVRGNDGMDEITIATSTKVREIFDGKQKDFEISPEDFGFKRASVDTLRGGLPAENAVIIRDYLAGKQGPIRDALLLNSGLTIASYNGKHEKDIHEQIKVGIESAIDAIDSGSALKLLNDWGSYTQEVGSKA
ncbi:MAG: anthranilate phosphoribosyltransferase [Actinomycetales bacterium]|jgi:anthranilate phosphoribosyltransferase|nr:MAG: anthranilate phosphoribosyltransferase [Actinomycetales bacterium]